MQKLTEILKNNTYPGRGIVVGKNLVYYFIMGRSENSRNRIFKAIGHTLRNRIYKKQIYRKNIYISGAEIERGQGKN